LPSFWTPREEIVRTEMIVRTGMATLGALIVFLSGKAGPALRREPLLAFTITLAIVLALGATELILRTTRLVAVPPGAEPRTHADARLGWSFDPSRTGMVMHLGHRTAYVFDRN